MAKTLKNGSCMIETNPLNHNWLDFLILSGLTLDQFQKKLLLRAIHRPKSPKRVGMSGTTKITFPHIFFQILEIGTFHKVFKHPNVKGFLSK